MTTIRIPIDPQPHPGINSFKELLPGTFKPVWKSEIDLEEIVEHNQCWKCPHQPGDRLPVRERWRTCPGSWLAGVRYEDGSTVYPEFKDLETMPIDWVDFDTLREASTMPDWAVRRWEVVTSVGVECVDSKWFWKIEASN